MLDARPIPNSPCGRRVAIGSLPPARLRVLESLPLSGCSVRDLERLTGIPKTVLARTLQDLALLKIVVKEEGKGFTPAKAYQGFFLTAQTIMKYGVDDENGV